MYFCAYVAFIVEENELDVSTGQRAGGSAGLREATAQPWAVCPSWRRSAVQGVIEQTSKLAVPLPVNKLLSFLHTHIERWCVLCFQLPFFEDMGSMTLQYVDSLFQRDNLQKSQFFKGLPKVIEKLPKVFEDDSFTNRYANEHALCIIIFPRFL